MEAGMFQRYTLQRESSNTLMWISRSCFEEAKREKQLIRSGRCTTLCSPIIHKPDSSLIMSFPVLLLQAYDEQWGILLSRFRKPT